MRGDRLVHPGSCKPLDLTERHAQARRSGCLFRIRPKRSNPPIQCHRYRVTTLPRHAANLLSAACCSWWSWTGSNRRPEACKATALPTELQPHWNAKDRPTTSKAEKRMVGLGRLELPTSRLSGVRSNHLSYRPVGCECFQAHASPLRGTRPLRPVTQRMERETKTAMPAVFDRHEQARAI